MAIRRRIACLSLLAPLLSSFAPATGANLLGSGIWTLVEPRATLSGPLPRDPAAALAGAVTAMGARLGVPLQPGPALAAAQLQPALAGRLALVLGDLAACHDATRNLLASLPERPGAYYGEESGAAPAPAAVATVRACAGRVQGDALELERFLSAGPA